jgi:hypothetical protein
MNSPTSAFNPARLNDQIGESLYATGFGKGPKLKRERRDRVDWLRKRYKNNQACQGLADKLEGCKRKGRCKSAVCPYPPFYSNLAAAAHRGFVFASS